ncbi:MAG: transporter substrate-binding domain-containing protein [Actinobacteria bacterium]|nr:transporter substrate-binding domain-containing protein [Actinomycetota bacterium]MSY78192.1 transporter substrate-binding domain-containing protein [Actinomycetota bacterium]
MRDTSASLPFAPDRRRPRYVALMAAVLITVCAVAGVSSPAEASRSEQVDPAVLAAATGPDGVLNIAVREIEPFAFQTTRGWSGYSIEMWEEAAQTLGIPYEYNEVASVAEQLESVRTRKTDTALGAISITAAREAEFDFSIAMYDSGLQILTKPSSGSAWSLVAKLFSSTVLLLIVGVIALLIIVGHIVWLVERRRNDHFPRSYLAGVWEGTWWAMVTMSTVGYGDTTVRTKAGRIVAMCWMLLALVLVAQFTAIITSTLTVNRLESEVKSLGDLKGKKVVTVANTSSAEFLNSVDIPAILAKDIDAAFEVIESGKAVALVFDSPILRSYVARSENSSLEIVGPVFQPQGYGMAFLDPAPILGPIDLEFLKQREDGFTADLSRKYLGE